MASEDFFVILSVVFKKFGLILNEFLPIVDSLFHIGIINLGFTVIFLCLYGHGSP